MRVVEVSGAATLAAVRARRSTRRFAAAPVPDDLLERVLEAGRWAPSANNGQPWYFVVVRERATRERLQAVADESRALSELLGDAARGTGQQDSLPDFFEVPVGVAVFADQRQAPAYVEGEMNHALAAGMALQNMWLAAEALGLGACLWTHLEQDQMKSILGVPHHYYFAGLLGLGYPEAAADQDGELRRRKSLAEIVGYEWFKVGRGERPPAEKLALLREFLK